MNRSSGVASSVKLVALAHLWFIVQRRMGSSLRKHRYHGEGIPWCLACVGSESVSTIPIVIPPQKRGPAAALLGHLARFGRSVTKSRWRVESEGRRPWRSSSTLYSRFSLCKDGGWRARNRSRGRSRTGLLGRAACTWSVITERENGLHWWRTICPLYVPVAMMYMLKSY